MAIFKCKMCGGDIEVLEDKTFGTCEYCGNTLTFPKVDDEQRAASFNRGNHFRRIGEFDKALALYEHIVRENEQDAEAHWCCALCRFGIEYVEDPTTFDWIPTCHRASFDNFLEDVDYLAALEYSDGLTKRQYQKDAAKIAEVQKGILATSQNEEPFDIFICYKESDAEGNRTKDSTYAQDIYYQLTDEGYRVFFARITLEDKAGSEYEPYIFAALNSAKVMIVIGTNAEYLNAVWVKNEWSRYLAIMKKDRNKLLLPCYREMDPYDMPEALSILQSYDMSKIGFIQDLIRGIKKVVNASSEETNNEKIAVPSNDTDNQINSTLKRAQLELADREWEVATKFAEQTLALDPENAKAYLYEFLAQNRCVDANEFIKKRISEHMSASDTKYEINWFELVDKKELVENYKVPLYFEEQEIISMMPETYKYKTKADDWNRQLKKEKEFLKGNKLWRRAVSFADDKDKQVIETIEKSIFNHIENNIIHENVEKHKNLFMKKIEEAKARIIEVKSKRENKRKDDYTQLLKILKDVDTNTEEGCQECLKLIDKIGDYQDCLQLKQELMSKYENIKYEKYTLGYQKACSQLEKAVSESDYNTLKEMFSSLNGYSDSLKKIFEIERKIKQIKDRKSELIVERTKLQVEIENMSSIVYLSKKANYKARFKQIDAELNRLK